MSYVRLLFLFLKGLWRIMRPFVTSLCVFFFLGFCFLRTLVYHTRWYLEGREGVTFVYRASVCYLFCCLYSCFSLFSFLVWLWRIISCFDMFSVIRDLNVGEVECFTILPSDFGVFDGPLSWIYWSVQAFTSIPSFLSKLQHHRD